MIHTEIQFQKTSESIYEMKHQLILFQTQSNVVVNSVISFFQMRKERMKMYVVLQQRKLLGQKGLI